MASGAKRKTDTIAAIATPSGRGGIGVVRISGPDTVAIAGQLLGGGCPPPRRAVLARFRNADGTLLDEGIALFFKAPASFTGEDVLELQGHGGPVVLDAILASVLSAGARTARPGEFSERAFLNNKLDLAQAEAVADLIDAGSTQAAAAAMRSLHGEFSAQVHKLVESLVSLRVYVEAAIDFTDEEIDFLSAGDVLNKLDTLRRQLTGLLGNARNGAVLREGLQVVIAGQPNVGKSSLLNQLAGRDSAIVTDIPGTTRDVLREQITLDGMPLHVIDTAGLRTSADVVEQEGIRRARAEITRADCVLLLADDRYGVTVQEREIMTGLPPHGELTLLFNKCDLSGNAPGPLVFENTPAIRISASTGAGMGALTRHLQQLAGYQSSCEGIFMARRRHLDALEKAQQALDTGRVQLAEHAAGELLAEELHMAQQALGSITGAFSNEDLLGEIFSSFCIGK